MILKRLELVNYVGFKFSHIKRFVWDNVVDVSIILGRNGTGKTSLLRAYLPNTLTRPMLDGKGLYTSVIEHDDCIYELSSDFSQSSSPHSFRKNGAELNLGGITKVQQELIVDNLGLTPLLIKLLTVDIAFTDDKPSVRKALLTQLNPANMTLALNKYKKVVSKIKGCKSNLKLLYSRKDAIESEMLKPEMFKEIEHHQNELVKKKEYLASLIHILQPYISSLKDQQKPTTVDLETVKKTISQINKKSVKYQSVDRKSYLTDFDQYKSEAAIAQANIDKLSTDISSLIVEINKYDTYLQEGNQLDVKQDIELKIAELKKQLDSIKMNATEAFTPIPEQELDHVKNNLDKLYDLILCFVDAEYEDIEVQIMEQHKVYLDRIANRLLSIDNRLTDITDKLKELANDQLANYKVPETCLPETCDLYAKYTDRMTNLKDSKAKLMQEEADLQDERKKLLAKQEDLSSRYQHEVMCDTLYKRFIELVTLQIPGLYKYRNLALETYKTNYLNIYNLIKTVTDESYKYYERQRVLSKIDSLQQQLTAIINDKKPSIEFVKSLMSEKQNLLKVKRDELDKDRDKLVVLKQKIVIIQHYLEDRQKIEDLIKQVDELEGIVEVDATITYYNEVLQAIQKTFLEVDDQLRDLNLKIQKQKDLQNRLDQEILSMIDGVVEEQRKYEQLEIALSPVSGFPHKYMVDFINNIIANMNVFISKVFTFVLKVHPINIEDNLTYNFKVLAGDIQVPDISLCSKGQKAVINLAFCLAVMVQLKLTNYPLLLDEISRALDPVHKQQLLSLLSYLRENDLVSQLIFVGHDESTSGLQGDVIYMDPQVENSNIQMITY